ncbi:MAG: type II toxin-antitoxin system MqsA family antitoxin [Xanthomonadales bacterium]|nr:type II toxin-antitoxin system MqsA family antitoxin [Xanthomonadales bacterium]
MNMPLTCTECGIGTLSASTWEGDFRHGEATVRVTNLECFRCDACGADPVFAHQIRRNQLKIADAKRTADGLLTGAEIRAIRERLDLTQAQASEVFGGGANAFSKYERGDVTQSVAMDRLIKVADFVPGVIEYLRFEAGLSPSGGWHSGDYVQYGELRPSSTQLQNASLSGREVVVRIDAYQERRRA